MKIKDENKIDFVVGAFIITALAISALVVYAITLLI